MLPKSLIESGLPAETVVLFAELDLIQGEVGHPARGYAYVARRLGWTERTVSKHAKILQGAGLIKIRRQSTNSAGSSGSAEMRVIHNDSRGRTNPHVLIPPIKTPKRKASAYSGDSDQRPAPRAGHTLTACTPELSQRPAPDAGRPRSTRSEDRSEVEEQASKRREATVVDGPRCIECMRPTSPPPNTLYDESLFREFCHCPF